MNDAFILLKNERLAVEIAKPGTAYAGSRFDWTGFITQVRLDDRHTFGTYESIVPGEGSGGIGFCNEFGLSLPVGYDEAEVGGGYLKVGIGTVQRYDDRPGDLVQMLNLKITDRAEISYRYTDTQAVFFSVNPEINGYRCELEKSISLEDNRMIIGYTFRNIGKKTIHTDEYTHNFMCFDGHCIGPDYEISIALMPDEKMLAASRKFQPELLIGEDSLCVSRTCEGKAFFIKSAAAASGREYSWKIREKTTGCSACETDSFVPKRMAVWGTKYAVAPEVFAEISLLPGEETCWNRVFRFDSAESGK